MSKEIFKICTINNCTGCGACEQICPHGCISMVENSEGFKYPQIDFDTCLYCKRCVNACPENVPVPKHDASFYMAWHRSEEVLLQSSSGGVFTALANYIFHKGGIVYGVVQNSSQIYAYHVGIEDQSKLDRLRRSKYYQSDTKHTYIEVKKWLLQGRWVLFTGTSCQIAGLYKVLAKTPKDTLITMDVLCHGVTSRNVVKCFIKDRVKQYGNSIKDFGFRIKKTKSGWQQSTRSWFKLENDKLIINDYDEDMFFPGFNKNLFLRESCYHCKYCGCLRISDFTAADFWGIDQNSISKNQLYSGVSLLAVNTQQGKDIMRQLSSDLDVKPVDINNFIHKTSLALTRPCNRPYERDIIFNLLQEKGYDNTLHTLIPKHFFQVKRKKIITKLIGIKGYNLLKVLLRK